ncbi:putative membrane protein [Erwinia sp. Ejp617]|nr:putative membrane protein [Erwinia sp. Ejp617]
MVMLCAIFNNIMSFHQKYNEDNYDELSSISQRVSLGLLLLAKFAVSLGSVLMFYGIWLA